MRLKYLSYFAALFIVVFISSSCSVGYVSLSVLKPAELTLPAGIRNLSVYNHVYDSMPPGVFDSVDEVNMWPDVNYNEAKNYYLMGLFETASKSPRFTRVSLTDSVDTHDLDPQEINWSVIESICQKDSSDALIVFSGDRNRDFLNVYGFFSYCYMNYYVFNDHDWSIYYPEERMAIFFELSDTLSWEGYDENCYSRVPDIYDLLSEACYNSGIRAGLHIAPYWEDNIPRMIFTGGNGNMRKAAQMVSSGNWYAAAQIWNRLSASPNKKIASKASFNIALAYERDDQLDQSILWIAYADSLTRNKLVDDYVRMLEERLETKELLDRQMQVN